jgi:carboxylesterase type B
LQLLSDLHMVAPTTDIADLISGFSPAVYQYHVDLSPSYHSADLNYLFGTPFSGLFVDEMSENGRGNISKFTETDRNFSRRIMRLWTSFAADG